MKSSVHDDKGENKAENNTDGAQRLIDDVVPSSDIAQDIGFAVLPNREVCIAGVKLVARRLPMEHSKKVKFLLDLWTWIDSGLKPCLQTPGATRLYVIDVGS